MVVVFHNFILFFNVIVAPKGTAKKVLLKKYSVFEFTGELTPEGLLQVDCVPSSWIRYDDELCSCVVLFPGPPYSAEDEQLLLDLISAQAEAPEDWPWFPITLRGHAGK